MSWNEEAVKEALNDLANNHKIEFEALVKRYDYEIKKFGGIVR